MFDFEVIEQEKIDANFIKTSVMQYARFTRKWLCCTECSLDHNMTNVADVMILDKSNFIEVEVKISKSDFIADFKKPKHVHPEKMVCNRFYFAVPENMKDFAKEYLKDYKKYGLMVVTDLYDLRIEKSARLLHERDVHVNDKWYDPFHYFYKRMCNELVQAKVQILQK